MSFYSGQLTENKQKNRKLTFISLRFPLNQTSRWTISRVMYRTIIYLDLPLPADSSDLPGHRSQQIRKWRAACLSCSVLLRMGFTCAPHVTARAVVSCTAFAPLPAWPAVYFCCTGLGVASTGCYPASCPVKPGLSSPAAFRLCSRDRLSISNLYSITNHAASQGASCRFSPADSTALSLPTPLLRPCRLHCLVLADSTASPLPTVLFSLCFSHSAGACTHKHECSTQSEGGSFPLYEITSSADKFPYDGGPRYTLRRNRQKII